MPECKTLRVQRRCGIAILLFSTLIWIVTTVFFMGAWDQVAAVTTFPHWSWALLGVIGALTAWRLLGFRNRLPGVLLLLWLCVTLAFADNLLPVVRGLVHGSAPQNTAPAATFRIATLNCASSSAAAAEVMQFHPEIVLLQECPVSNEVVRLAREWFGDAASFVVGFDCAIVSRHPLETMATRLPVHYTRAIALLPGNREVLVTSLRFTPPLGNMDLWRPATWRAYREDRKLRKSQLQSLLDAPSNKPASPEIMGGDFNAPAGDGIYRLLGQFCDSHRIAGRGWGNTALNTLPLFRPDQIWLKGLVPVSSHAVRTVHSDHRMVVADVLFYSTDKQSKSIP
jgi:endonuclease/exonuclease/phosphatase (EEP) superfamily protein YafD